jgi:hypothetical protein
MPDGYLFDVVAIGSGVRDGRRPELWTISNQALAIATWLL